MSKSDIIISELIDALDLILREARKNNCSRHYIQGVCEGTIARCNAERVRNSDGYLVVSQHNDLAPSERRHICGLTGTGFSCPACDVIRMRKVGIPQ